MNRYIDNTLDVIYMGLKWVIFCMAVIVLGSLVIVAMGCLGAFTGTMIMRNTVVRYKPKPLRYK